MKINSEKNRKSEFSQKLRTIPELFHNIKFKKHDFLKYRPELFQNIKFKKHDFLKYRPELFHDKKSDSVKIMIS